MNQSNIICFILIYVMGVIKSHCCLSTLLLKMSVASFSLTLSLNSFSQNRNWDQSDSLEADYSGPLSMGFAIKFIIALFICYAYGRGLIELFGDLIKDLNELLQGIALLIAVFSLFTIGVYISARYPLIVIFCGIVFFLFFLCFGVKRDYSKSVINSEGGGREKFASHQKSSFTDAQYESSKNSLWSKSEQDSLASKYNPNPWIVSSTSLRRDSEEIEFRYLTPVLSQIRGFEVSDPNRSDRVWISEREIQCNFDSLVLAVQEVLNSCSPMYESESDSKIELVKLEEKASIPLVEHECHEQDFTTIETHTTKLWRATDIGLERDLVKIPYSALSLDTGLVRGFTVNDSRYPDKAWIGEHEIEGDFDMLMIRIREL
jgi:hypothetical protein